MTQKPVAGKAPLPVEVANEDPLVVEMVAPPPPPKPRTVTKGEGTTLAPTTTEETDRMTEGQRKTSFLWEVTQAIIAYTVVAATVFVLAYIAINLRDVTANQLVAAMQLNVMATLVLTFYYARTNSHRVGGVGPKPGDEQQYLGR